MIIKKPYAFLIKHFRLIHLVLSVLLLYLTLKTSDIFKFFNDYVKNGFYTFSNDLAVKFINFYLFIDIILIILIALFIYLLMKWKKKNRTFYVSICIYYFLVFIALLFYFNIFNNILNTDLDVRTIRAYRDISAIMYFPQYFFLIYSIFRAIGFDIKKFDFKKDLADLDISEEDQEEIEVTFGQNSYKYKRKFRRLYRELSYYALENKFFFFAICGIVFLTFASILYFNFSVYNKKYDESEFFTVNGVVFRVLDSYVSDVDLSGNYINKDKKYFIIKVSMENTNYERINLETDTLRLLLDDEYYFPVYSKSVLFRDLGEGYNKNTLYAGESYEYLMVYEVPKDITYKKAMFRMVDSVSIFNGEISAKYKDVKLELKDYINNEEVENYDIREAISFDETTLLDSELLVDSYEINDSFVEVYRYCVASDCYDGKKVIKADPLGKDIRTIMKVNLDLDLNKDLYLNKFINNDSDFVKLFGNIYYSIGEETKVVKASVKEVDVSTDYVYIEIPEEVKNASKIDLVFSVRNRKIVVNLK